MRIQRGQRGKVQVRRTASLGSRVDRAAATVAARWDCSVSWVLKVAAADSLGVELEPWERYTHGRKGGRK